MQFYSSSAFFVILIAYIQTIFRFWTPVHMKRLLIILLTLAPGFAFAQTRKLNAISVLQKTMLKLEQLRNVSYHHTRETHYYADNSSKYAILRGCLV